MPDIYQQISTEDVILTIFAVIVILIIGGCIYSFFSAIFFFIFSGGKEEKKKKGRNSIRFMIIGVLLTVVLMVSFPYVLKSMGIQLESYSTKNVFSRAGELILKVFKLGDMIKDSQMDNQYRGNLYYDINNPTGPSTPTPIPTTAPSSSNYQL